MHYPIPCHPYRLHSIQYDDDQDRRVQQAAERILGPAYQIIKWNARRAHYSFELYKRLTIGILILQQFSTETHIDIPWTDLEMQRR